MSGKTSVNVSGAWKDVGMASVNVGGVWKDCISVWSNVAGTWKQNFFPPVPVGLILPYTSASAPTGWARFTSADDKNIIGAGSTYGNGSTGGSTSVSVSGSTTSTSTHGVANITVTNIGGAGGSTNTGYNGSAGAHSHTFSGSGTFDPQYYAMVLMKATSDRAFIPTNMRVLGDGTGLVDVFGTTLTGVDNQARILRSASSTGGTGGSDTVTTGSVSLNTTGAHTHHTGSSNIDTLAEEQGDNARRFTSVSAGNHNHSGLTLSNTGVNSAVARINLKAFTNESSSFVPGVGSLALWESVTPPTGWALYTPSFDRFVVLSHSNVGSTFSAVNISLSGTTNSDGGHNHGSSATTERAGPGSTATTGHAAGTNYGAHSHTGSFALGTRLPAYYGLYWIEFTGIGS
jgi:hypothetical protein